MPSVIDISNDYRNQLIRREAAAERELARAYMRVRHDLEDYLDRITRELAHFERLGIDPSPDMLFNQARVYTMLEQIEEEVDRIARGMGPTLERLTAEAIQLGDELAMQLLGAEGITPSVRLPNDVLQQMVGRLRAGSPVEESLRQLGPDAAARVRQKLITGVIAGWGPGTVALELSNALGGNLARAMTLARTEMIQAYRNAALFNYRRFPDLIDGWIWTAAVVSVPAPCPVCAANHGRVFPLEMPFGSHPNCRCSPAPLTRGSRVPFETGPEWFERQDAATQMEVLGPMGYLAYQDGVVGLEDFVKLVDDPRWGPTWQRKTLDELLGDRKSRYWAMLAAV